MHQQTREEACAKPRAAHTPSVSTGGGTILSEPPDGPNVFYSLFKTTQKNSSPVDAAKDNYDTSSTPPPTVRSCVCG